MRHPSGPTVDGSDFHGPPSGPLALPGSYQATLRVGAHRATQPFELLIDPRVETNQADFEAQFELLSAIQGKLGEAIEAVNRIKAMQGRLEDWAERIDGEATASSIEQVSERLSAIEGELIQREFTTRGDSLNYREKLLEKLGALVPVVASADTAPTKQSHQVFDKLAGQIDDQLGALDELIQGDLAALDAELAGSGLSIIGG